MRARSAFYKRLRSALNHFYDLDYLRLSPLADDLNVAGHFDTPNALQKILTDAIETLKPPLSEPLTSKRRQIYDTLNFRYIQQFKQDEVANHLGISERQLRRVQGEALDAVACYLWNKWELENKAPAGASSSADSAQQELQDPLARVKEEWAWLTDVPPQRLPNVAQVFEDTLKLARPMAEQRHVELQFVAMDGVPDLAVHAISLRQIVLNLLGVAIQRSSDGQVRLTLTPRARYVDTHIQGIPEQAGAFAPRAPAAGRNTVAVQQNQLLTIARHLTTLSGGKLAVDFSNHTFDATLSLPTFDGITVLVIDDNEDIVHLLERYAQGNHYSIVGVGHPDEAIESAIDCKAQIIVLDVMMPGIDGWEMLGRLRQHPLTAHVPIMVLTILAQEELALSLGAKAFVLKPVSQESFLAALERLSADLKSTPG